MKKFFFIAVLLSGVVFLNNCDMASSKNIDKPNILFIMVDDLGKEWISCYGAEDIKTPHIDALAKNGMKFNKAYSMPQCTPSRTTLLTGKYPFRTGWVNHWDVPRWGVGYFDWKHKRNMTFASIMKTAGYTTAAAGKWQISDFRIEPQAMKKHGFDDWCMWTGYEAQNKPSGARYQNAYINRPATGSKAYKGQFGPDIYVDFLIDFMKKNKDKPMMLYFPMVLTHGPFVPTPDEPKVESDLDRHKAMVRYTDKLVGRLVKALEDLGLRKKTFVIFTTDNGSGGRVSGHRNGRLVKGAKANEVEAGVCEPFIVSCPSVVASNVSTEALTDFSDLLPSFAELGGATLPEGLVVDGKSFVPHILGKATDTPRDWILAMGHGAAKLDEKGIRGRHDFMSRVIRDKQYKVWVDTNKKIVRLHDLIKDPYEETNLINVKGMETVLNKFQKILDAQPDKDARPLYTKRQALPWDMSLKINKADKKKKDK